MSLPKAEEWTDPGSMDPIPRRGRSCMIVATIGLIAVVGSFVIWRATSLVNLPNGGEPFDLKASGTIAIADDENAFTYYRLAVSKLAPRSSTMSGVPYLNWAQINQKDRDWYLSNVDALEIWLTGTTMNEAVFIQPRDQTTESGSLELVQRLRSVIPLARLAGLHMEAQGELDAAWSYYRGALRMSRHCGMHGSMIERMVGVSMYLAMTDSIRAWADRPNLNRALLRVALDDVIAIDAMTPSLRGNYEAEYFALSRLLDDRELTTWTVQSAMEGTTRSTAPNLKERAVEGFWRITRREPERSRRVLRHVWANWLSVAGLSATEQSKRQHDLSSGNFYDPPANAPASARMLTPTDLNSWVKSTRYVQLIVPDYKKVEKYLAREQSARAALIINLAECLYIRDHGHLPESSQELVGAYLTSLPEGFSPVSKSP